VFSNIVKSAQHFKDIVISGRDFTALPTTEVLKSSIFLKRDQEFVKVVQNKNCW